jgi:hypothetical protein
MAALRSVIDGRLGTRESDSGRDTERTRLNTRSFHGEIYGIVKPAARFAA